MYDMASNISHLLQVNLTEPLCFDNGYLAFRFWRQILRFCLATGKSKRVVLHQQCLCVELNYVYVATILHREGFL